MNTQVFGHWLTDAAADDRQSMYVAGTPLHQAGPWGLGWSGAPALAHQDDALWLVSDGPLYLPDNEELLDGTAIATRYRDAGLQALEALRGPGQLVLLDRDSDLLYLRADPLGIGTLYYAQTAGGIVFGNDARQVARHPAVRAGIDPQALLDYLYFHVVPAPRSAFAGVHRLLPAEHLQLRNGSIRRDFYWALDYAPDRCHDAGELREELLALLPEATRRARALYPGHQVACFLSGGIDSSTVAGMWRRLNGSADTYSIGFDAPGYDETEFARTAARHFDLNNHEYYVRPADVVAAIPGIAAGYDAPFGNASAIPAYCCTRNARSAGFDLMLAGDGGDEIFGGNARYVTQATFELYQRLPAWLRRGLLEPLTGTLPANPGLAPLRKLKAYVAQARVPLPDRLERYNFLHQTPAAGILSPDYLAGIDLEEPLALAREVYQRTRGSQTLDRMLHLDMKFTLADNDLRKVVRTAELAGSAVSFPFLDQALVEFAGRVPPELKIRGRRLRHFFKDSVSGFLPDEIINKSKHGFGLPFGLWLRDDHDLHELARESLDALVRRGLLQADYRDRLWHQHAEVHATYYGVMIWVLMMLEQWLAALDRDH